MTANSGRRDRPFDVKERLPRPALILLAAVVFAAITTEVIPVGLLPVISRDLQTSESNVGLLVRAYAVVVAVCSIPLAALVVRWPRRRVLCGLLSTYALSNAVMAGCGDYWIAMAARLLGGVAHAGFFGGVFAAAVSIAPPTKSGKAVAFVGAGTVLALAFGVPLGTALGTAFGWRWVFAGGALLMAVLAALTLLVLPATDQRPGSADQTPLLKAVRGRPIVIVAIFTAMFTLGHFTPYTYISPLLRYAGVSADGVSVVLLSYGLGALVGLLAIRIWPFIVPTIILTTLWGLGVRRATDADPTDGTTRDARDTRCRASGGQLDIQRRHYRWRAIGLVGSSRSSGAGRDRCSTDGQLTCTAAGRRQAGGSWTVLKRGARH